MLKTVNNIGMVYANLRLENILVKLTKDKQSIEDVRFINFGSLAIIEDAEMINIPD